MTRLLLNSASQASLAMGISLYDLDVQHLISAPQLRHVVGRMAKKQPQNCAINLKQSQMAEKSLTPHNVLDQIKNTTYCVNVALND